MELDGCADRRAGSWATLNPTTSDQSFRDDVSLNGAASGHFCRDLDLAAVHSSRRDQAGRLEWLR